MNSRSQRSSLSCTIKLRSGYDMPMFGLGVYGGGEVTEGIVAHAINQGYRLVDTGAMYGNEKEVGDGIKSSGLKREDLFVITKVWYENHGHDKCTASFCESLKKLDCKYLDMYMIHFPKQGKVLETYDAMLKLQKEGLIRSIGVSNFGILHLEELRKAGRPAPCVNQIELHVSQRHQDIVEYCRDHGIAVMGYSPLMKAKDNKLQDPVFVSMARRYGKSVAQLLIRWSVQNGYITIPKTSRPERILENSNIFDFSISEEDMKMLNSLPEWTCMPVYLKACEDPWEG